MRVIKPTRHIPIIRRPVRPRATTKPTIRPPIIRPAPKTTAAKTRTQRKADFLAKDDKWYDEVYAAGVKPGYWPGWDIVVGWIGSDRVADFGCGTGQFDQFMVERGCNFVYAIDYSAVGVAMAKQRVPTQAGRFHKADLRNPASFLFTDYDVAVFMEVLEHIPDDLAALRCVPVGKRVIITLPSFDYVSHYRHFDTLDQCCDRYKSLIAIKQRAVVPGPNNAKWWLLDGTRI